MAKPPVPSIVLKTAKLTQAQKQAQIVQRAHALEGGYRAGLPTPGGNPGAARVAPSGATVGQSTKPPIAPNYGGSVKTLTGAKPLPNAPAKPAKVKVQIHPDGTISVTRHGHTNTQTPTPFTGSTKPKPTIRFGADTPGGPKAPDIHTGPAKPKARVPATTVTAPQTSIEDQAQAILDPVKQSILDAINARLTNQQTAITNYSKDLAQMMGQYGPAAEAAYGNAQTGQAAVDAALGQTLSGAGNAGQAALAGKLAQIDADPGTAARINGAAAAATQGAASAAAGRGSASLSDLISRGAAAGDYGAKLPGVAGLYGLQATKSAQAQGTTDTANAVSQVEQQLPTIVNQIRTNRQQQSANETTRALAATQALGKAPAWAAKILGVAPGTPSAAVRTATTRATAAASKVDATLSKAYGVQTNSQGQAITGKDGKPIPYPTGIKDPAAPKVNVSLSKLYGVLVDDTGSPILHNGKPVEVPAQTKPVGPYHGLSASKYQSEQAKASGLARIAHEPTADGHPAVSWQTYLTGALQQSVPWWIAIQEGKRVYSPAEIKLGLIPGQGK